MADLAILRPNTSRAAGTLHRSAITTADLVATPGTITPTDQATGGALLASTTYYVAAVAVTLEPGSGAILGVSQVSAIASQATAADASNTHKVRAAFALVTGADGYLLFCSTDNQPKLVGYVTEAQRLAGGVLTAFGTVGAGGAANSIDIGLAGTGLQTQDFIFGQSTAHLLTGITAITCTGYKTAFIHVRAKLSKTAVWTAAPILEILPWIKSGESSGDWFAGSPLFPTFMAMPTQAMHRVFAVDVVGATSLIVTIARMVGLASVDVWVELV